MGQLSAVTRLVAAGADVNARGEWGAPALHEAACWGRVAVAQWLVDVAGADASVKASDKRTAIEWADANTPVLEAISL